MYAINAATANSIIMKKYVNISFQDKVEDIYPWWDETHPAQIPLA